MADLAVLDTAVYEPAVQPAVNADMRDSTLRALLIPYRGGQAIVPNNLVVEALPFASPLGLENAPLWVLGSMLWKSLNIPLVSLEYLTAGDNPPETGAHSRIIVLQAINNMPKLRYFGVVGSEAPRMEELQSQDLSVDINLQSPPTELINQVLVHGQRAIIPDMDAIEKVLSQIMSS